MAMLVSLWPAYNTTSYSFDSLTHLSSPTGVHYPIYHFHRESIIPGLRDTTLSVIIPLLAYWVVSIFFSLLDYLQLPSVEKYRLHEPEEVTSRNRVTPRQVVQAVVLQQIVQTAIGLWFLEESTSVLGRDYLGEMQAYARPTALLFRILLPPKHAHWVLARYGKDITQWAYWWGLPLLQYFWASFIMDTWQYFWHRAFHVNQFLYKHIHSVHHRLYCPYAFGALYNHPLEGFILDTLGALVAQLGSRMSIRQASLLFGLSTAKTVDDHCGLALPWDPFQHLFGNNADYHDIHHQQFGIKKNFSQPYFVHWDVLLGTRMTREEAQNRFGKRSSRAEPTMDVHTDLRDESTIISSSSSSTTASPTSSDSFHFKED